MIGGTSRRANFVRPFILGRLFELCLVDLPVDELNCVDLSVVELCFLGEIPFSDCIFIST